MRRMLMSPFAALGATLLVSMIFAQSSNTPPGKTARRSDYSFNVVASQVWTDTGLDLDAFMSTIERDLIQRSLERTGGNKGQAARLLGLKRTTLVEKLKRLEKR